MNLPILLYAAGAALGSPAVSGDETGAISGKVVWQGERPEPKPALTIKEAEAEGCVHGADGTLDTTDRSLLISEDGGVANVVLTVEVDGMEPEMPSDPVVMDQVGCRFQPHVVVVPVGGTLRFDNSDETNHNIHTFAKKNDSINKNVAAGTELTQELEREEVIEVKCDIHTWMKGYVVVTEAPRWSVTEQDGRFRIEGLPPGDYKLEWWHEELGKGKTDEVTVAAGEEASLDIEVGEEKKSGGRRRRR